MSKTRVKFAVIGAGPTGLGAAWRLQELQQTDWMIFERSGTPGGLASSVVDEKGFTWDLGGHVLFSHYSYFDDVLDACVGNEWNQHQREAWIYMRGQFIPYPLQNNIWRLPEEDLLACLDGLLELHNKPRSAANGTDLASWTLQCFGKGLSEIFFEPYNKKVWAYSPKRLSSVWIQERVSMVDLNKIIRNIVFRKDDLGWGPNATFRFPLRGGTGTIWKQLLTKLPADKVKLGNAVVAVDAEEKQLTLQDGSTVAYDFLINSMPLDKFIALIKGVELPANSGSDFVHSSTNLVGIGITGTTPPVLKTKSWIYFVEDEFPFYRCTVFSNYSPFNVPQTGKQWSMLCEISESPERPVDSKVLAQKTIDALIGVGLIDGKEQIVDVWQQRLEYGYPTPFLGRDEKIAPIESALKSKQIFSRGRFGAWKYEVSNQDHSFMQGVEAVSHIIMGTEEITYHQPGVVNAVKSRIEKLPAT